MKPLPTLQWKQSFLQIMDQRKLPEKECFIRCRNVPELASAIRTLAIRGAPAIGLAAAYGVALCAANSLKTDKFKIEVQKGIDILASTRPTAVNLFFCLEEQKKVLMESSDRFDALEKLVENANIMLREDLESSRLMGRYGADLMKPGSNLLTHCNAGGLATAGLGTALAVFYEMADRSWLAKAYADETRPLLQGSRLTAWELERANIDVTVLPDSAAASLMESGAVDAVFVGADRIAANGDVANKIGTYPLALAAREAGVPFYVVAPLTTFDREISTGKDIEIEQRSPSEVSKVRNKSVVPAGINIYNPAFDVTPFNLIDGIVCEKGVIFSPCYRSIHELTVF